MTSYNDGHRELPRNMNVSWFGRWLGTYFDFKQWKKDTTNGGIRKSFQFQDLRIKVLIMMI